MNAIKEVSHNLLNDRAIFILLFHIGMLLKFSLGLAILTRSLQPTMHVEIGLIL